MLYIPIGGIFEKMNTVDIHLQVSHAMSKLHSASTRCNHPSCAKKLTPADVIVGHCKCDKFYCLTHRLPEMHECQQKARTDHVPERVVQDKVPNRI